MGSGFQGLTFHSPPRLGDAGWHYRKEVIDSVKLADIAMAQGQRVLDSVEPCQRRTDLIELPEIEGRAEASAVP